MKVPTHLRDHVKKYDEIKSPPASGVKPSSGPKTASKKAKAAPETPGRLTEGHKEKDLRSLINQKRRELDQEYQNLMNEKERIAAETKTWRIRYSVRKRKSVARGKLMELKVKEAKWQEKFQAFEKKKKDLQQLENRLRKEKTGKPGTSGN